MLRKNFVDAETKLKCFNALPLFPASDHHDKFDARKYLESFYKLYDSDIAMYRVIMFMPCIVSRLPEEGLRTFLDVGCGPCIHTSMFMYPRVEEIYLADYAEDCRAELTRWMKNESEFNWESVGKQVCKMSGWDRPDHLKIQEETRNKVVKILECDVNTPEVLLGPQPHPVTFDVVSTTYCLEAATESLEAYRQAFANVANLVRPGGYLIVGGVLSSDWYVFDAKRFKMTCVDVNEMKENFRINGFDMEDLMIREKETICMAVCKKLGGEDSE